MAEGIITRRGGVGFRGVEATGGTESLIEVGQDIFRVHSFTNVGSSSFNVTRGGEVEYLVVAGGGAGGRGFDTGFNFSRRSGGRGGGGSHLEGTLTISNPGSIPVSVGSGGSPNGGSGGSSGFSSITGTGGGGGGNASSSVEGSLGVGGTNAGDGGQPGSTSAVNGTAIGRSGGGGVTDFGGGVHRSSSSSSPGGAGAANRGGGGGGGGAAGSQNGGPGGSGVVIVRYKIGERPV